MNLFACIRLAGRAVMLLASLPALSLALGEHHVLAQASAWRTITLLVGFDVGGVTDILARLFSKSLATGLGQPVIVENKPGAAGVLAATAVARSAPDGYTLLFAAASQMLAAPKLQGAKFNPFTDFAAITPIGANTFVLIIRPSIPAKTIPELVSYAKRNSLTYGSPGAGSVTHLLSALFIANAGFEATHVPFRGGDQALAALLGNQIDMYFSPYGNIVPYLGTKEVTLLGVASERRVPQLPDVPVIGEFYPNTVLPGWNGFMAPAHTPKEIIEKLAQSLAAAVKNPDIASTMSRLGVEPQVLAPEVFAGQLAGEGLKFDAAIAAAKLR
ncbi:MAG TPA: tripartite tricarboxylate transporter substrate binding protein [Xanthobacteraceae bacterium]|jgi:tripartite-type tricarboxylate transporter receptor subunit TctC